MNASATRPPPQVRLERATLEQRQVLLNLFQLYVHDFSEQWQDRPDDGEFELTEGGRFHDYPVGPFWELPEHIPLLLRVDGRLAGFALVDDRSHTGGGPLDRNMTEFFVVRKHRRSGVGTAAAHAIFSAYPGVWEAAVARRNTGALAFWRNTVASHPAVEALEEAETDNASWDGWVLRFRIGKGG